MTTDPLVPCTCHVVTKRDGRTLLSTSHVIVNQTCPHHGLPKPQAKP